MTQIEQPAVRNRLLAALSPDDFGLLARSLNPASLDLKLILYAPGQTIESVYFPEGGIVSMLVMLEDGAAQEVGLIGREGLVGLPALLGADSTPMEAMVQASGSALRIRAAELKTAFDHSPTLRALLLRYMHAMHLQVSLTAACNGRHALEERFARWLLMAHDRAEGDRFPMTQEFISMMLGVRRAGVSVAAGILQKAGVISYRHGCITVLDRPGLEGSACECYGMVRQQFERLLGQASGQNLQPARGLYASGQTNAAPYRPLAVKASGTTAVLRDLEQSGGQQP